MNFIVCKIHFNKHDINIKNIDKHYQTLWKFRQHLVCLFPSYSHQNLGGTCHLSGCFRLRWPECVCTVNYPTVTKDDKVSTGSVSVHCSLWREEGDSSGSHCPRLDCLISESKGKCSEGAILTISNRKLFVCPQHNRTK